MPISNERVPNRPLSGRELAKIIEDDVHDILNRDGMFTENIAFSRVSYEVRVSMHLDNPVYPEHISTTLSKQASKQQVENDPALAALETAPLTEPVSDEEMVFSEETARVISSPNMARVEHDMPLTIDRKDMDTGQPISEKVKYKGDMPDPATVGNITTSKTTVEEQKDKWNRKGKRKRK